MKVRWLVGLLLISACRFTTTVDRLGPELAPTSADKVALLWAMPTDRPYEVVGRVVAAADVVSTNESHWTDHFKQEAAKLGGDAVVVTKSSIMTGTIGYTPTGSEARVAYVIHWKPKPAP